MVKRVAAAILWFYAVASVWNGMAMGSDLPAVAGFALGAFVAIVVWADPLHVFAPSSSVARMPGDHSAAFGVLDRQS